VTEVSFAVKDTHASEDDECSMWRTNMATAIGDATGLYGAIVTYTVTARQVGRLAAEPATDNGGASSTDPAGQ
jgi:hypothetical protein